VDEFKPLGAGSSAGGSNPDGSAAASLTDTNALDDFATVRKVLTVARQKKLNEKERRFTVRSFSFSSSTCFSSSSFLSSSHSSSSLPLLLLPLLLLSPPSPSQHCTVLFVSVKTPVL
jgi:hypothetical protein